MADALDLGSFLDGDEARAAFLRHAADDIACFFRHLPADHRPAGLDDAGFLGGDLRQCLAEKGGMLDVNACDDGDQRCDHVRRIEPSAHAGLQHADVRVLAPEIFKCQCGGEFEKRHLTPAGFSGEALIGLLDLAE